MGIFDYVIKETLAVSTRSVVRRAVRKSDGRTVIIKSPAQEPGSTEDRWRLEFEHRLLQKLNVPAVVQAIALERDADSIALVLEDFGGRSPHPPEHGLTLEAFFPIAIQAARGLGQIHDQHVVHKDIKPSNLLLNEQSGELKFIDFHLASELSSERQELTAVSQIQGSLPYISPEQTGRMNRELDYRSDYYSLGITFFELVTGTLPFQAADAMGFVHAHLSKRAPLASQVEPRIPAMLSELIAKLMAKDPDDRYQSWVGIASDLERCEAHWRSAGSIPAFSLGAEDVSERFTIPQKLFGRARESERLFELFRETCAGRSRLVLVSGPSGIGKTALIHELQRPITRENAHFVSGKFDQLDRNVPYGAFVEALRQLVKRSLFESDARLDELRRSLTEALLPNGQVVVDLIPELGKIIGPQPAVALLGATETQHRFRRVFLEFIKVFARPQHPLVIFIDDLQWMDASSPALLQQLLGEGDVQHLLVLGSYRDNEVRDGHLLTLALRNLREQSPDALRELHLGPLPEPAVNELVAETLRAPKADVAALTRVLFERTEGNPFFVSELLSSLQRAGAFSFVRGRGCFTYDLDRVRLAAVSDSVADLMVRRLEDLSPSSRRILTAAACVGAQFELGLLAELTQSTGTEVAAGAWEALMQRIIVPLDETYRLLSEGAAGEGIEALGVRFRFQHDRVQRAAYHLLAEAERAALHLALGRRLVQREGSGFDVFEVVNHLQLGGSLLEPHERQLLLELHLRAGDKAERSAAFAIAAQQLECAIELAQSGASVTPVALFDMHRRHVKCIFLNGEVERAFSLCEPLFQLARSPLSKAAVYVLKTQIVEHQGKLTEAVATIRSGLALFGVHLPEDHDEIGKGIGDGIAKMQAHLRRVPVEALAKLPELEAPERVMTLDLLFQLVPAAIQTYPPLFVLAELLMFDLALSHGVTPISAKNFVDCGIIQGGILGDHDVAYRLGQAAFELLERYRPTPLESSVHFVFAAFVSQFRRPFREGFDAYERAARAGLELGDIQHAAYATVHRAHRSLLVGSRLPECEREAREALEFLEHAHAAGQWVGMLVSTWSLGRLRGGELLQPRAGRTEAEAVETLRRAGNAQWLYSFGQAQTYVSFLLGDRDDARRWQAFTEPFEAAGVSLFSQPDYHLFRGLLTLDAETQRAPAARLETPPQVGLDLEKLTIWAQACPENFAHKQWLLAAELARFQGKPLDEVLRCYERAISATDDEFIQFSALAQELEARYLIEMGHERIGKLSLQRAHRSYQAWGATAKLERLAREFPELASTDGALSAPLRSAESATTQGGVNLDLASVLKATRAISSEVRPERLFRALMDAIIENAGAELGCLILRHDTDRYQVESWAAVDAATAESLKPAPLDEAARVCRDVVRYVIRTHERVVLDDAADGSAFEGDAYLRQHSVRSLLCIPVLSQGALVAVLYAENNATRRAFTRDRVETLSVIAAQAAISISNALLYQNLEQKVEARTRELAEKNREISAMLDGMEQGIFTIDRQLKIQPQYSAHLERVLGTSRLSGQPFVPLLFRGARVRPDQLAATETALRFCFDAPSFLAEANLSHALRTFERVTPEGDTRFLELDWNLILDAQECVSQVLVAVRDVTLVRRLEELARRREREADLVGQILDSGLDNFREFAGGASRLLDDCEALLGAEPELDWERLSALFRAIHTIKGNARLFGYSHLVDAVHSVEEVYSDLRSGRSQVKSVHSLVTDIGKIATALGEYEEVCERKLKPLTRTRDARLKHAEREIGALLESPSASTQPEAVLRSIREAWDRLSAVSLMELVKNTSHMLPSLAGELCKVVPVVECADRDTLLGQRSANVLKDVLVQAFRNALDHGIEAREEREMKSKAAQGVLKLRTEQTEHGLLLRLADDGRGLAVDELRRRTGRSAASDEELAEAVFSSGVSTADVVSKVSGRGVGMDLIRSSLRTLGGDATISFTGAPAAGFRPFELVLRVPRAALST